MLQNEIDYLSSNNRREKFLRNHQSQPILVSVIIPTYNNGRFLAQALNSVFQQNYSAYELIVVDDGSTDDTQSVLLPFQDKIHYVYQKNSGSAIARNAGLALAQGEYIVFLDADDLLLPDKLEDQVAFLNQNPLVGMVHSGWLLIDEDGNQLGEKAPWEGAPKLDLEAWLWKKPIKMGAMMYRKHWLRYVKGFDPELRQSQDTDLMLRLSLAGCTAEWIKKPTMCYRQYSQSTIRRNAPAQYKYLLRVQDKAFAHPNMPEHLRQKKSRARYFSLRWVIWHIYSNGFPDEVIDPMQDAAGHSPYTPFDMTFDWLSYIGQHLLDDKRPLSDLDIITPQLKTVVSLSEDEWHKIERFLPLFFQDYQVGQKLENIHTVWPFWQTAVLEEERTAVCAEKKYHFWQNIWRPYFKVEPNAEPINHSATEKELIAIGRLCIAYEAAPPTQLNLIQFWNSMKCSRTVLVAWQLTVFGQNALRWQWVSALKALMVASWNTIRSPRAVVAWADFIQATIKYFW